MDSGTDIGNDFDMGIGTDFGTPVRSYACQEFGAAATNVYL